MEELKRQLQPKRAHIHDDDHEMLAYVDYWDLSVHHRETTTAQNRRNVEVESVENQPKPHTGTDGFLCHVYQKDLLKNTLDETKDTVARASHARVYEVEESDPTPVEQNLMVQGCTCTK